MIEAALIERCADPSLPPAIVEAFIERAGSYDPLAITVRAGDRVVAIPKPQTPEEALDLVRRYVALAHVRAGITQLPAGLGIRDPADVPADLFDACSNLARGTAMFADVYHVAVQARAGSTDDALTDAIAAWRTGFLDGEPVFAMQNQTGREGVVDGPDGMEAAAAAGVESTAEQTGIEPDPYAATIRVDLSGLGAR